MNRRAYLAALSSSAAALSGCLGRAPTADGPHSDGGRATGTAAPSTGPGDLPVDLSTLNRPVPTDAIPAITDPVFGADWAGVSMTISGTYGRRRIEPRLDPDDEVIGISRNGTTRAYPLRVLAWHEVVNDVLPRDGEAGEPLLVTYCPLCASGVTARRTVRGQQATFGVSGYLYESALVMYDDVTGSLWSQVRALGIHGPETGTRLDLLPTTITTWAEWQDAHPETTVLRPPPESGTVVGEVARNYARDPYVQYEDRDGAGITNREFDDERLHPKARAVGVVNEGVARAYDYETVLSAGVVNDTVAGLPVVVGATPGGTMAAYVRRLDGETVTFDRADDRHLRAAGSRWLVATGEAVDGPHEGRRLESATKISAVFWFSWLERHPETELYGREDDSTAGADG